MTNINIEGVGYTAKTAEDALKKYYPYNKDLFKRSKKEEMAICIVLASGRLF